MKYRFEFMNQGQIGDLFGESSHVVGKWLTNMGLRKNGSPSSEAFQKKLVIQNHANGGYNYVWHTERTVAELENAGHKRVAAPPATVVEPPPLSGPFTLRAAKDETWQLVGSNNEVAIIVTGEANAKVVSRLLNSVHDCGKLQQPLS